MSSIIHNALYFGKNLISFWHQEEDHRLLLKITRVINLRSLSQLKGLYMNLMAYWMPEKNRRRNSIQVRHHNTSANFGNWVISNNPFTHDFVIYSKNLDDNEKLAKDQ